LGPAPGVGRSPPGLTLYREPVLIGGGMLGLLFLVAIIGLAVLVAGPGQRTPDPTGQRPYARYLLIVSFISLFTALFASTAMVNAAGRRALHTRTELPRRVYTYPADDRANDTGQ